MQLLHRVMRLGFRGPTVLCWQREVLQKQIMKIEEEKFNQVAISIKMIRKHLPSTVAPYLRRADACLRPPLARESVPSGLSC